MKQILTLAGATALAFAGPAVAKPGNGLHGPGHGHGHGHGVSGPVGYGVGGCPPGLQKKGCMPPGQAKKFAIGQRLPTGYGARWDYDRLPLALRNQYGLAPSGSYYYGDGHLYRVDPRTMLVQQVLSAVLR